jgi:hypothetical protein
METGMPIDDFEDLVVVKMAEWPDGAHGLVDNPIIGATSG